METDRVGLLMQDDAKVALGATICDAKGLRVLVNRDGRSRELLIP